MPCYRPIKGYRARTRNPSTGKRSIVFSAREGLLDFPIDLPCGQCIGCRLEKSRQWAMRCVHEASLHEKNCFITLTYDEEQLPPDLSVDVKVYQDFMKRLRFRCGSGIRFFHCGEYGCDGRNCTDPECKHTMRPHYHACLFNFDFPDRVFLREDNGNKLYTSELLSDLWPHGFSTVGDVTFESAAYVARYVTKKVTGGKADKHYTTVNPNTGEIYSRRPEYCTMSRRPGIGAEWFNKYTSDVYPSDEVILRGKRMKPPKFYDSKFEKLFPDEFFSVKAQRKHAALHHIDETPPSKPGETRDRLSVREECHEKRAELLIRGIK